MERVWLYYYLFLLAVLISAVIYHFAAGLAAQAEFREHFIRVNLTKTNDTCRLTWIGGWDFDSFYANVTVNNVSVGHPQSMTTIYNDTCKNLTVRAYDKSVHTDEVLYRYRTGAT